MFSKLTAFVILSNINLKIHRSGILIKLDTYMALYARRLRSSDLAVVALLRDLQNIKHTAY
jgi:hypothetical protein